MKKENIFLNNKENLRIGFGTWLIPNGEACKAVCDAIHTGYRLIDTASYYKNEKGVGEGIKNSGAKRENIFLTSKLWNDDQGYDNTLEAIDKSLDELGVDYVDMYLVHWPVPAKNRGNWKENIIDTWNAMEEIYNSKKARFIGVSNFLPKHLDVIKENCKIMPAVNQIEYHISYMQQETVSFCEENDITIQAWSPLARGGVFEINLIKQLADKYNITISQLCLAWIINKGIVPIPKTLNKDRMVENLKAQHIKLSYEDIRALDKIEDCKNSGHHPDKIQF